MIDNIFQSARTTAGTFGALGAERGDDAAAQAQPLSHPLHGRAGDHDARHAAHPAGPRQPGERPHL